MQFNELKRREFITLLGGAAAGWPVAVRGQQAAVPVIGFLNSGKPEAFAHFVTAFRQGLKEAGFIEGQNVTIEYRWAEGQYDQLPAMAADLVRRKVAVISAAGGALPTLAAKAATSTIPIVFEVGDDPIKAGLVDNLNRPGGNVTGASFFGNELGAKRLALLRELLSASTPAAVLVNPSGSTAAAHLSEVENAAREVGQKLVVLNASDARGLDEAFAAFTQSGAKALIVNADPVFFSQRDQIVAHVERLSVPAIYYAREFTFAGGLMSYGTNIAETMRESGVYVGKLLKGARVSDLPVLLPTRYELVINVKTAKALGLTIPPTLLALADEVIE